MKRKTLDALRQLTDKLIKVFTCLAPKELVQVLLAAYLTHGQSCTRGHRVVKHEWLEPTDVVWQGSLPRSPESVQPLYTLYLYTHS